MSDEASIAELSSAMWQVTETSSFEHGAEACDLAKRLKPDVVLMDLNMANMDGVEATSKILRESPDIRIVVLTSFSDHDRVAAALDAGAIGSSVSASPSR